MTNESERFQLLSRLFDEAVEVDPARRAEWVAEACGADEALASDLHALLDADGETATDDLIGGMVANEAAALQTRELDGTRLGNWIVVKPIGEGGMGTVYLAERADGAYEAQAALKLVRGGIPSPQLDERFKTERQILAGLSHPGVAQLLDGGNTPDGTPYLVMEYIDGAPITRWCEEQDLDVESRLRLFLKVCDAVGYAHSQLVAHRDLKPSNILVTKDGEPKLLDFGIAKLMDSFAESEEGLTQSYAVMTPAYASPEQVTGERANAAADTYSLGVLLYEMLSGRLPINTKGLTPAQLITRVTQEVPAVLSSVVEDHSQRKQLAGDLDAIVSRALRKEPEGRYASVQAMADDVKLHLEGRPIRTRSDDWRYRTGKTIRRNAGVVSGTLLLVLLGISFTVNTLVQARAVARERDRAEAQRQSAERVSGFLEELFTEADPNARSAREVTLREVLDRGADRVLTGLEDEPESRATLAQVIGRVYSSLGEYDAAEPLLDSAVAARERLDDGGAEVLSQAYVERGALAYNVGEYEEALEHFQRAVQLLEPVEMDDLDDRHALADAIQWEAVTHSALGDFETAETQVRRAVALHREAEPGTSEGLAIGLKSLQDALRDVGKNAEAVEVGEEALAMNREFFGNDHLETAHALNQMASSLRDAGRAEEAIPFVEEGLAIRRRAFEGAHVEIAASLGNLANMMAATGRDAEAIGPRRESVAMLQELFPSNHPYVAASTSGLGTVLLRADSLEAAESVLLQAVDFHRQTFPDDHPNHASPLTSLGTLYRRTDRLEEARRVLTRAYEIRVAAFPEGHWLLAGTALELGRTYESLRRDADAERHLQEAYDMLLENFGTEDTRTGQAREALRGHLERRGLTERAGQLGAVSG